MTYRELHDDKAQFEAQRREAAAIAAEALQMRILERDFIKVTVDLKGALERL
ncbi:MAG: hypothetical protein KGO99_05375 [Actinomycetales bacterium]|nr:hypothetical protein [Actinomycetales bacterium]